MISWLRPRSIYDVMATLGFCALLVTGTAYAANTVFSSDIVDGEVKGNDLAADSVGSGKIADQQVKNADLGLGASSSNTIADGGIQGIDVKDNTLKGADIDESSLVGAPTAAFDCPGAFTPAGDVCFDVPAGPADYPTAEAACQTSGMTLPSVGEARLIQSALGVPAANRFLWTGDHTSSIAVISVFQNTAGVMTESDTGKTGSATYTCVRAPVQPSP